MDPIATSPPAEPRAALLVLGLGNVLGADDGVGPAAVAALRRGWTPGRGVEILDGGTRGMALLPDLEDAAAAILVDAVQAGAAPGGLVRLEGDDVPRALAGRLSAHQMGAIDLLNAALLRGKLPPKLVLWGVVPASLGPSLGRSAAVAAAIPRLVEAVVEEAGKLGHPFTPRPAQEGGSDRDDDRTARVLGL